jgi:hypothetical protein
MPNGDHVDVPARWIGQALAVHAPVSAVRAGRQSRGQWAITGRVHGLSAGIYRGPLRDAVKLARVWDAAFADALPADRVTAPSLAQWELRRNGFASYAAMRTADRTRRRIRCA